MNRAGIGLVGALLLFTAIGCAIVHHFDPGPVPFAAEDEKGDVLLWPGSAEPDPPASPALLVAPCPLGPQNLPIRQPENDA